MVKLYKYYCMESIYALFDGEKLVPFYNKMRLMVLNVSYFSNTGLKKTSVVKCDKLMTIYQSIIIGLLGEIPSYIITVIDKKLKTALSLQ